MKVVLFCGGLGMRMRDYADGIPKPMVSIGYRPILWHIMKYYAHFGHKDFILCLGYRGDVIKEYFLNYNECVSNDFTLSQGGRRLDLASSDISEWRITFVDTGIASNIGQRLKAVERHLAGESMFLANYSDGLTDLPLPEQLAHFAEQDAVASFLAVNPNLSYHLVSCGDTGRVTAIKDISAAGLRINGGYFALKSEIFNYLGDGEELVYEPFQRLINENKLTAFQYDGLWLPMDTFKDRQRLEEMHTRGDAPWQVWNRPQDARADTPGRAPRSASLVYTPPAVARAGTARP
jgi:glucose-1-phosphate cytidylyltransferase